MRGWAFSHPCQPVLVFPVVMITAVLMGVPRHRTVVLVHTSCALLRPLTIIDCVFCFVIFETLLIPCAGVRVDC